MNKKRNSINRGKLSEGYRPRQKIQPERVIGERLRVLFMRYGHILTDEQYACCQSYYFDGFTMTQIGMVEGRHTLTVRSHLIRAIRKLVGAAGIDLRYRANYIYEWLYGEKDYIFGQWSKESE